MKNRELLLNKIIPWPWSKQAAFGLFVSDKALEMLRNSGIEKEDETYEMLEDLTTLCWSILSNNRITLRDLDEFLDPEGERYSESSEFIDYTQKKGQTWKFPILAHAYFVPITTAGYIGNRLSDVRGNQMSGGTCYVGNVGIEMTVDNALTAGVITPAILETFGIDPSLDLSSYIASK